jgi:putative ABC transport system permease protein
MGGTLGLVLGMLGIRALLALNTVGYSRIGDHGSAVTADWRVLVFTVTVSLATGILFGIIPALQVSRGDLVQALKEGFGDSKTGLRQNQLRSVLVAAQITLALVLLIGAGLLIRSFIALRSVNPGFDTYHVLTMRISLTASRFQKASGVAALVNDSVERIRTLPGVAAAAVTCCLPFGDDPVGDVIIVGRPLNSRSHGSVSFTTISPSYFDVFKIAILRGRSFTERDGIGAVPAVIISEAMARRFWPGDDPLSASLKASLVFPDLPTQQWRIIGVSGDVRADGLSRGAPPIVYFPIAQAPDDLNAYVVRWPTAWVVRTQGESYSLSSAIQNELRRVSGLPISSVRSMGEVSIQSTADREFNMLLLSIFGAAALLLAAIGIYGLMAYSVRQRTREIGIRMAVGAESSQIRSMVVFEGMRVALVGVVLGIIASFGLTHLIAAFLFGVKAYDPPVFTVIPILLSAVAFVAVWLPARRASKIEPTEALRHE